MKGAPRDTSRFRRVLHMLSSYEIRCRLSIEWSRRVHPFLCQWPFGFQVWWYGIEITKPTHVAGCPIISKSYGGKIKIGSKVALVSSSSRATASSIYSPVKLAVLGKSASIVIGDNVGLNGTSITARSRRILIGSGTMIAPNVTIVDSDFHALWPPESRLYSPAIEDDQDVVIGQNVWIGMQSIILKGTTIGDGAVIGAGSVIRGEIPPNVLAAGVPARVIRSLV